MDSEYFGVTQVSHFDTELRLSPAQRNELLEDKLMDLMPILRDILAALERTDASLADGSLHWRRAFNRARARMNNI